MFLSVECEILFESYFFAKITYVCTYISEPNIDTIKMVHRHLRVQGTPLRNPLYITDDSIFQLYSK